MDGESESLALLTAFPDWHLSTGHAHPDVNSFIIYARGSYLTGDSGYAGIPLTEHHNTMLIDGKGQAREGKGHDAFDDVPYDRLDKIRIAEVKLEPNYAYIRGEAASAYEPELGVARFSRNFLFTAPDGFVIWDDMAATRAGNFTVLLHADEKIEATGKGQFSINASGAKLQVQIVAPEEFKARIEPNILTAPGKPGSVDKGERQQRGERLAVSNATPAKEARFVMLLKISEPDKDDKASSKR